MTIRNIFIRFSNYRRKHGVLHALFHSLEITKRDLLNSEFLIYIVDLESLEWPVSYGMGLSLQSCADGESKTIDVLKQLSSFRDPRIIAEEAGERFRRKAELWYARRDSNIVAFVWAMYGDTPKPYFFQLNDDDVYLFDNEVLEEHRGQGINAIFLDGILYALKEKGYKRAFIDTETWNISQMKSLGKTKFRIYAHGQKIRLFGLCKASFKFTPVQNRFS